MDDMYLRYRCLLSYIFRDDKPLKALIQKDMEDEKLHKKLSRTEDISNDKRRI